MAIKKSASLFADLP